MTNTSAKLVKHGNTCTELKKTRSAEHDVQSECYNRLRDHLVVLVAAVVPDVAVS